MYRRAEQTHLRAGHRNQRRNTTGIPNITVQMIRQVTRRNNHPQHHRADDPPGHTPQHYAPPLLMGRLLSFLSPSDPKIRDDLHRLDPAPARRGLMAISTKGKNQ
jgi:hypothetical protein